MIFTDCTFQGKDVKETEQSGIQNTFCNIYVSFSRLWIIVHVKLFAPFTVIHLTAWHDVLCNLPHKFEIVRGDKLLVFLFFHQILRCLRMRHVDE